MSKTLNHLTTNSATLYKLAVSDTEGVNLQSMEDEISSGVVSTRSLVFTSSENALNGSALSSPFHLPFASTVRRADFAIQFAPAADTFTFELFKNGVGTGVTLNHTGADLDIPWPGLSTSYTESDEFTIVFTTDGANAGRTNYSVLFESS